MNLDNNSFIIKARFIDHILNSFCSDNICIGQEVMYGTNRLLADLVLVADGKLYAFEIKAYNDDLRRIENQLANYRKIFDFIYVITTENHLANIRNIHQKKVGIYVFNPDGTISEKRRALEQKSSQRRCFKYNSSPFLKKYFSLPSTLTADQVRGKLMNCKREIVKNSLHSYMKSIISYISMKTLLRIKVRWYILKMYQSFL
nr:sce7726 family protein [Bacteroides fragilis]